ncbi:MAG: DNA polymerase, partial [Patescibacteria group bacterium]
QTVAATGRLSSSNPNLQNIPIRTELGRSIRRAFVAQKDFLLLSCDYSQIELRIVAALAKDTRMIQAFEAKQDIHTATAAAIWNVHIEQVTPDQRRAAKAVNFGVIYGQGAMGLSRSAGIPFEEAKRFIDEYFHVYSGVRRYLDETKRMAAEQGYVETSFGRRRTVSDIASPLPQIRAAAERMAINMPVQGTAADIMKLAMIRVAEMLPSISSSTRMLLQVHDELVFEVPEADVSRVATSVTDIMEHIASIGVPLAVDAKVGKDWGTMELPFSSTRR